MERDLGDGTVPWGVAAAVLLLAQGEEERARGFAHAAADQATPYSGGLTPSASDPLPPDYPN